MKGGGLKDMNSAMLEKLVWKMKIHYGLKFYKLSTSKANPSSNAIKLEGLLQFCRVF